MSKNYIRFIGTYLGSKIRDNKNYKDFLPDEKKINKVVEPFCGSFGLIRDIYKDSKHKKYINDINTDLFNYLNFIKNESSENIYSYIQYYNDLIKDNKKHETHKKYKLYGDEKKISSFTHYFSCSMFSARFHRCYNTSIDEIENFKKLIKKCNISNKNYFDFIEQFKNDKKAFIYLDPPYFDSCNTYYITDIHNKTDKIIDNTKMYIDILDFLKNYKCHIMLIINKNAITEYIYKDFIKGEYEKIYTIRQKKTKHLIITNY